MKEDKKHPFYDPTIGEVNWFAGITAVIFGIALVATVIKFIL